MKHSETKILSLLLALCLLLCGCGAGNEPVEESLSLEEAEAAAVEGGKTMGEALAATYAADDVFSLNAVFSSSFHPYVLDSAWNQVVSMLVYEPLVVLDESFEAQPGLVTAWSTDDGRNWTFTVDTTRRFHSGGRMTSYDCSYSIRMASYTERYADRFAHVDEVVAVDDATFTVSLTKQDYSFYKLLGIPCIESGSYYEDIPAGSGPYKFSTAGDMLLLDSQHPEAENLPLLRIYLKEYTDSDGILQAFEDSYIDLVINNPTALSNLGYASTNISKYVDTTNMHYLGYNMNSLLFSQAAFRAIMTYAIDRSKIVSDCMSGAAVAAALPVHPNNSLYPEDIAASLHASRDSLARALQQTGVIDMDGDGFYEFYSGVSNLEQSINFIVCADSSAKVRAATVIADRLEEAGLRVNLRELSYDEYILALEEGDFDMYYAEVKLRPNWDLTQMFDTADDGINYGNVRDQFLNEYVRSFLSSPPEMQEQSARSLWQYIAQQAPITVICFERSEMLYHRGVLSGLAPVQDNLFYKMTDWTVNLDANK